MPANFRWKIFSVAERYQQIQNECNRAVHEAASRLPKFPGEMVCDKAATARSSKTH